MIYKLREIVLLLTFHSNNGAVSNIKKRCGNYQIRFGKETKRLPEYLDDLQDEGNCVITDFSLKIWCSQSSLKRYGNYQIRFGKEKQKVAEYLDDLQVEGNCGITDLSLKIWCSQFS
jgi:hypothetical protein